MFPIILERDAQINEWNTRIAGFPTAMATMAGEAYIMRSDGVLYTDFGSMYVTADAGPTLGKCECVGLYLTTPEELDEFTPYQISAFAMTEDPLLRPFLFCGIAPATITNDAGGDTLSKCRILGVFDSGDAFGAAMEVETTIVNKKMPSGKEGRALAIGIGFWAGQTNGADKACLARVSVRRLVGVEPAVIDTRKL